VTVTVDDEVVDVARRDVAAGRASSLSAWVSDAMRRKALGRLRLELELDELRIADPYTDDDVAWAAEVTGLAVEQVRGALATPSTPTSPS